MPKYDMMVARFPGGASETPAVGDYLLKLQATCLARKVAGATFNLQFWRMSDTPITMSRNRAIQEALKNDVHYLFMLDCDMAPDMYLGVDRYAKPFFETTMEFMLNHKGPCLVAAPYCGPPPQELVYVFHWKNLATNKADPHKILGMIPREEAGRLRGIQEVAALPTGMMVIDMRAMKDHPYPHFYYEWEQDGPRCEHCQRSKPGPRTHKASTEDVAFTRDLSLLGVPNYCNWDAWAGHFKKMCVGKPVPTTVEQVGSVYKEAILKNVRRDESVLFFGDPSDRPTEAEIREALERTDRLVAANAVVANDSKKRELTMTDEEWDRAADTGF